MLNSVKFLFRHAARYIPLAIIIAMFLTDSSSTDAGSGTTRWVSCDCGCTGEAERTFVTQRYGISVSDGSVTVGKRVCRQCGRRSTSQYFTNCQRSNRWCDSHRRRTICAEISVTHRRIISDTWNQKLKSTRNTICVALHAVATASCIPLGPIPLPLHHRMLTLLGVKLFC